MERPDVGDAVHSWFSGRFAAYCYETYLSESCDHGKTSGIIGVRRQLLEVTKEWVAKGWLSPYRSDAFYPEYYVMEMMYDDFEKINHIEELPEPLQKFAVDWYHTLTDMHDKAHFQVLFDGIDC